MTAPATEAFRAGAGRDGGRGRGRWRAALVAAGAALLLAGCYTLPAREDLPPISFAPPVPLRAGAARPERNAAVFDAVWNAVDANYYDPAFHGVDWTAARRQFRPAAEAAPDDDRLYGVINAMLGELHDGHTRALSPRSVAEQRERRWVWIGFECAPLKGSPELAVVTDVWPGGPALEAGVRRGWIVETCDGLGAQAFVRDYRRDLHLRVGQVVPCVMRDDANRVRRLDLTACATSVPAVRESLELTGRFLYLRFDSFKEADARWLDAQLRAHRGVPAVVIDLRYNVGGELEYLESIAGLFLPRGRSLGTFSRRGRPTWTLHSRRPWLTPRYRGTTVALVSRRTASAAEIFVDRMQQDAHCVVLGQNTAGEVLDAYLGDLPDGGRLGVSIWDYHTPDGRRLQGLGVAPDAPIDYDLQALRAGRDSGIDAALRLLRGPSRPPET